VRLSALRSVSTGHPTDRALDRYVDREPTERARVAEHLVRCAACRAAVAFRRNLRDAVCRLPQPEPSPDLLMRVLTDRASGQRLILPNAWPEARRARAWPLAAGLAAAAAVVLATWLPQRERPHAAVPSDWFVSGSLFVDAAGAQAPAPEPPLSPAGPADGARLRPRTLQYVARWTDTTGHERFDGRAVVALDSVRMDGAPVWRVAQTWRGETGDHGEHVEAETLWVARADLRPLARGVHVAPYNRAFGRLEVTQRFVGDSVLGAMHAEGTDGHEVRRPIARRLPDDGAPYLTDAFAPLFLSAVDVGPRWARRVTIAGWAVVPNDVVYPVALRVVGAERVTTPAGTFDCWRLLVTARGRVLDYWVRKGDGVGVRSRDAAPRAGRDGTRGVREVVLTGE